jgi:hypothetical protein
MGEIAGLMIVGLGITAWTVSFVAGVLAVRHAHTVNRLRRAVWLTMYLEPQAFSGKAARYRRVSLYAAGLFLALTFLGFVLPHSWYPLGSL